MVPMASGDVCKELAIDRSTFKFFREHKFFPQPAWTVSTGPLWDRAEVLAWRRDRAHSKKTRYADGLRLYRYQLANGRPNVSEAAREATVHPDTFRAYLREVGEPLPSEL